MAKIKVACFFSGTRCISTVPDYTVMQTTINQSINLQVTQFTSLNLSEHIAQLDIYDCLTHVTV